MKFFRYLASLYRAFLRRRAARRAELAAITHARRLRHAIEYSFRALAGIRVREPVLRAHHRDLLTRATIAFASGFISPRVESRPGPHLKKRSNYRKGAA